MRQPTIGLPPELPDSYNMCTLCRLGSRRLAISRCKTRQSQSLGEPDNQGNLYRFLFRFERSPWLAVEEDHLCGVDNLNSAQTGGMLASRTVVRTGKW